MNKVFYFKKAITQRDLFNYLVGNYEIFGADNNVVVNNAANIENCNENSIIFIAKSFKNKFQSFDDIRAGFIVTDIKSEEISFKEPKVVVVSDSPRTLFSFIVRNIQEEQMITDDRINIHPTAIIHPNTKIGLNVSIGPFSIVNAEFIGNNTSIGSHVSIDNCVQIGNNVKIGNFCCLGSKALSLIVGEPSELKESFPQLGGVVIEDGVSIGEFTSIHRGALEDTIIRNNTFIDTFIQVSHNVEVGNNSVIIGHSHIGGSVKIGCGTFIGQSVTIANVGKIGSNSFLGIGSVVINPVEEGQKVFGNPARKYLEPKI